MFSYVIIVSKEKRILDKHVRNVVYLLSLQSINCNNIFSLCLLFVVYVRIKGRFDADQITSNLLLRSTRIENRLQINQHRSCISNDNKIMIRCSSKRIQYVHLDFRLVYGLMHTHISSMSTTYIHYSPVNLFTKARRKLINSMCAIVIDRSLSPM